MYPALLLVLLLLGAYFLGGVPFGYLVARWRGVDIFAQGSGNIGATNVGRVLGRRFGLLVFALDFAKGALPVAAGLALAGRLDPSTPIPPDVYGVGAGLAALLGHLFSPYLGFRGGKGVATGAGVVVVLFPVAALGALLAWIAVVSATRTVSLASLTAAVTLCLVQVSVTPEPFAARHVAATGFCFLAAALVFARHRANIRRLLNGTENRLPESPAMQQLNKSLHVLALGLWFGSAAFFLLVVTVSLFGTFEAIGASVENRPFWLPVKGTIYDYRDDLVDGPREQGSRVAGAAVGPIFPIFFALQGVCGLLAAATSLNWSRTHAGEKAHRVRTWLVLAALVTVLIGWPIEHRVTALRPPRNTAIDAYLFERGAASDTIRDQMQTAKREFFLWHMASLGLAFVTLGLVTVSMVLAARLPETRPPAVRGTESGPNGAAADAARPRLAEVPGAAGNGAPPPT
jgi:acyl phosphate:glycerol-3-phosphate acyltransferase